MRRILGELLAGALLATGAAVAQELDPRTYSPTPIGTIVVFVSGGTSEGAIVFDPSLGIDDAGADLKFLSAGAAYVFDLAGRQARVLAVVPYAWGEVSANLGGESRREELGGTADPRFKLTVGLLGAPALTLDELRNSPPRTALNANLTIVAPWGEYDPRRLVNLGSNRWAIKPELGVYRSVGRFTLEAYAGVWFFADNDESYPGQATRRQEPLYAVRGHVARALTRRIWLSVDATWFEGGETETEGLPSPDRQDNARLGATLSLPLGERQSLKLSYNTGTTTLRGSDYDTLTLTWQAVRLGRDHRQ
jgi:hypothetical protein